MAHWLTGVDASGRSAGWMRAYGRTAGRLCSDVVQCAAVAVEQRQMRCRAGVCSVLTRLRSPPSWLRPRAPTVCLPPLPSPLSLPTSFFQDWLDDSLLDSSSLASGGARGGGAAGAGMSNTVATAARDMARRGEQGASRVRERADRATVEQVRGRREGAGWRGKEDQRGKKQKSVWREDMPQCRVEGLR